ncbi:MAG: ATP-dependent DNA helicase [Bacteroidetes bacterium]|nr:ATP-dependent DNA helicase [Bacteroidota bacterium]MDA0902983.1 ATP-dependent DNA helicase [Bacteroidota bacterium]MDA1241601.1 ATP-dependent DNA helicase [Bacteroidota bacterium]
MSLVEMAPSEALKRFFGFDEFKGEQEKAIQAVLEGHDTFVIMPTGGGKSMCYQLPALMLDGVALVVSPLIALMKNQVDAIRGHHEDKRIAHFLNSSLGKADAERVKMDVAEGATKLLYVAPESLTKPENIAFLKSVRISFVAVDEAHCISEWGHDFRPEYRRIKPIIKGIADVPVMALTATATPKVQQDIQKNLDMTDAVVLKASFNRDNLFYEVRPKKNALQQIVRYGLQHAGKSGIVYCLSRKKVEQIAETLRVNGVKALAYHAGMDGNQRSAIQDQFLMQDVDVIVATIAFGMGIDKPDVRYVIHYDMPKSLESYYQETGRAGRDGGEGRCIAFYSHRDIDKLEKFLQGKPIAEQEVGMQLLQEVIAYAETATNRRKFLLHYFGESFDEVNGPGAQNCDNSQNPPVMVDRQEEIHMLLGAILEHKSMHRMEFYTSLLTGENNRHMEDYGVVQSAFWKRGVEHSVEFWQGVIRQMVVQDFVVKEVEKYGVLHLSKKGKAFLTDPYPVMLAEQRDFSDVDSEDSLSQTRGESGGALDPKLRSMLTDLRKQVSAAKGLPPYVIFQDVSLDEMATHYPITPDELIRISGVGSGKAAKFGKPFTDMISNYVEEEGIEREDALLVRSSGSKSSNKVTIIQLLDRKMGLDDIAAGIHGQRAQVLEEIEAIVDAGTKVNLDHILEESLDEDCLEELFDFFRESEEDGWRAASEEFEDAYSEEELRLARIKFLCEVAH